MWPLSTIGLVLCLLFTRALPSGAKDFRFVFINSGDLEDFGLAFRNNIARINLQNILTEKYPNINTTHVLISNASFDVACDPRFEAWCRAGVDLFIADSGHQSCFTTLATVYPKIAFTTFAGWLTGPPNYANLWARVHQPAYLAGYTAGLMTSSKKVCVLTVASTPASIMDLTGFCRGVVAADPSVDIHVFRRGVLQGNLEEVWIVNQSYALGCDVVWVHSVGMAGVRQASQLGLMSIGFFTDARLIMGDTVITSIVVDMTQGYVRAVDAVLNGTFRMEIQKPDWWMGWNWGVMSLADFSFLVPKVVQSKVQAQIPTLDRIFCGRVCTAEQCLCNASSCCLTDPQLNNLWAFPDFIHDHGIAQLPGKACLAGQLATWHLDTFTMNCSDCPAGTYAYNADEVSECRLCPTATYSLPGATNCTACPAGTYGDQLGLGQCAVCPAGSIAPNAGAKVCSRCDSALSNGDRTQCESPTPVWVAGVGGGVGAGVLIVAACLVWYASTHGKRNNSAAPKDPFHAFCIVFTDIQGSTTLWASVPDVMAVALDTHHALVRRLIAKYSLYEVKTIGDSFMCATQSPAQAVQFALALQEEFVQHDWGTNHIDRAYADLICSDTNDPGCWNGLRIRAGIHYGHGDIKLDPTSKGYDYYGTVVNTAARIESVCHGGQTGVSAAVFEALGGHCPGAVWADLGLQPLRGLAEPLRLYQVLPEGPLAARRFPPLRIERADDLEAALKESKGPAVLPAPPSGRRRPSGAPMVVASSPAESGQWAETHPLVAKGAVTAEELRRGYHTLQAGLATLLTPLQATARHDLARDLCAIFHVPNYGSDGSRLLRTLDGLVKRALPSTVLQSDRQPSLLYAASDVDAGAGSPRGVASSVDFSSPRAKLSSPRIAFANKGHA
eukprot:EG_transcript_1001